MTRSAQKKALRGEFLSRRASLPAASLRRASDQIFEHWKAKFETRPSPNLHIFRSVVEKGELDTQPFIDWAHTREIEVVSPRVQSGDSNLVHHLCIPSTQMLTSAWGIPEPHPETPTFPVSQLRQVLVPLLAFDPNGHRLGYGGGYYDRFLSQIDPKCLKLGLCLELGRLPEALPAEPFDVPLDGVFTEQGFFSFGSSETA